MERIEILGVGGKGGHPKLIFSPGKKKKSSFNIMGWGKLTPQGRFLPYLTIPLFLLQLNKWLEILGKENYFLRLERFDEDLSQLKSILFGWGWAH